MPGIGRKQGIGFPRAPISQTLKPLPCALADKATRLKIAQAKFRKEHRKPETKRKQVLPLCQVPN